MQFKYHPEIEGLKINEDGSEVLYHGKKIQAKQLKRKVRNADMLYIYINRKTLSLAKLICECWHGMAENPRWCATRRNKAKGFHYTNLYFAPCGTNPQMGTEAVKRSSLSKLSKSDVKTIQKRLKKGDTLKHIAKDYNTTDMSINRIKKKMTL